MEDLYEVLEVSHNASKEVIEKAYKVLVKRYHPDVAKNKENSDKMIKKINNAYAILSDTQKRKEYDDMFFEFKAEGTNRNSMQSSNVQYTTNTDVFNQNEYVENKKSINIDNRILVALIIVASTLFIISCTSLYMSVDGIVHQGQNENMSSSQSDIGKPNCEQLVNGIQNAFNSFDMATIESITGAGYFSGIDTEIIKQNMDIYTLMISNINIKISGIKTLNNKVEIQVNIIRNNVEDIFLQYYFARSFGLNNLTPKKERELLLKSINDNSKEVMVSTTFTAIIRDNQWKIELDSKDILDILGISISKYVDIFNLIS